MYYISLQGALCIIFIQLGDFVNLNYAENTMQSRSSDKISQLKSRGLRARLGVSYSPLYIYIDTYIVATVLKKCFQQYDITEAWHQQIALYTLVV